MLGVARPLSPRARVRNRDMVVAPNATPATIAVDVSHHRSHEELAFGGEPILLIHRYKLSSNLSSSDLLVGARPYLMGTSRDG
jgi:hypothetical protein